MIEVLRISDMRVVRTPSGREGRVLAFDLRDLLPLVADEAQGLRWAAIPLGNEDTDILGDESPLGEKAFALGAKVDASEEGVPLEWNDLVELTGSIRQTAWGTFVGVRDSAAFAEIPRLFNGDWRYVDRGTARFYEIVEIAFQAVDSAFWQVWVKDTALRERIRSAFSSVETIPGESRYEPS